MELRELTQGFHHRLASFIGTTCLTLIADSPTVGCVYLTDLFRQFDIDCAWKVCLWKTVREQQEVDSFVPGHVLVTSLGWSKQFWDASMEQRQRARRVAQVPRAPRAPVAYEAPSARGRS